MDLPWPADIPRPEPAPDSPAAQAEAERLDNLNNSPGYSDSPFALDDRGRLADPRALAAHLAPLDSDDWIAAYLDSYYQVVRQYADGRLRANRHPRQGSRAEQVLQALVVAGDARFSRKIAAHRQLAAIHATAREIGLAS